MSLRPYLLQVLNILLSRGTKYVVITSTEYGSPDRLVLFAGSYKGCYNYYWWKTPPILQLNDYCFQVND